MAIQTVDLTVPGGDTPRSANTKINANFSDQTNAASRLVGTGAEQVPLSKNIPSLLGTAATKDVGTATGNVMQVGAFGLGDYSSKLYADTISIENIPNGFFRYKDGSSQIPSKMSMYDTWGINIKKHQSAQGCAFFLPYHVGGVGNICLRNYSETTYTDFYFYTDRNTIKDSNGFLKGASPVVDLHGDRIEQNEDALKQNITFEKLGVGDYLVKGSLGFAQEGWYIETPKDANGNVLVAVVYEQLENNDLSIKTYAKKFDDETGDIVANLIKPRDIPTGRFISLRLHELPKEPPVMPTQDTSADAPAQTNNP